MFHMLLVRKRNVRKVLRFISIYGLRKTFFKVAARKRVNVKLFRPKPKHVRDVAVIGCGQFSFATIGYALVKQFGNRFVDCFDTNPAAQKTFSSFYGIKNPSLSCEDLINNDAVGLVYVVSNHASHADYTISALKAGKKVYVEKPISVDYGQLRRLLDAVNLYDGDIYAGYNRPFSAAIRRLANLPVITSAPLTLNYYISGHVLADDHWYRNPEEGTRICGNVGHWLDLTIHILSWGTVPDQWEITIAYSDAYASDENLSISLVSDRGDLVNIVLTARGEPFEGINETINFQQGNVTAKIDDFRKMTIWNDDVCQTWRYWPKDVGHNLAISQPFSSVARDWHEVVMSTLLMLFIKDMVIKRERFAVFSFTDVRETHGVL